MLPSMLSCIKRDKLLSFRKHFSKRVFIRLLIIVFIIACISAAFIILRLEPKPITEEEKERLIIEGLNITLENDLWIPDGGDNVTGWVADIVPNIVHYVLFENHWISYVHMMSFMTVIRIQKPLKIILHCDCAKMDDGDQNWDRIIREVNKTNKVIVYINHIERPTEIFGQKIEHYYHASDITRYRIMHTYGGIYIDNDVLITQPLNPFFKYEFTLNWDDGYPLGSQILLGNRNSRFAKFAIETYRAYNGSEWYYNAGLLPTKAILWKYPHLVHRVRDRFGELDKTACRYFYTEYHNDWHTYYFTFHMMARGNEITKDWKGWCLLDKSHFMWDAKFDDDYIRHLNNTFGEIGRYALFGHKNLQDIENEENNRNNKNNGKDDENQPDQNTDNKNYSNEKKKHRNKSNTDNKADNNEDKESTRTQPTQESTQKPQ